jgi:predicted dehydrogenase/nucleoside-diphosphate-sugar epimerase
MQNFSYEEIATLKIGIIGCGLNSDYHINFARTYPGAEIVGVADINEEKGSECARKYGIPRYYSSLRKMVADSCPEIIHIVTPPTAHYDVAREAIDLGVHVVIEKPLTLHLHEAKEIYSLAEAKGVKLCPMHNHYFDPCMLKARALVEDGRLGHIINVESYYGLNTRIDAFRRYPAPNVLPWLYSLPGGVFQDFMAHPLYVMLPYSGRPRDIRVIERSHGELPQDISDELRILVDGENCAGTLVFSFAAKPHLHFLRLYGTKGMVQVDFNTMTTVFHPLSGLPKAAQKVIFNVSESKQLFYSTSSNVWNFLRGKLKPYHGMQNLIHRFYDNIMGQGEVPVRKEHALMVMDAMEEIFKQVKNTKLDFEPIIPVKQERANKGLPKILVTGASGFLGGRLVEVLAQKGYPVRALVRKLSSTKKLKTCGVEILFGDVGDLESLRTAFREMEVVVHAAADTAGNEREGEWSTIQGTRNVLQLCGQAGVRKLIYISSCAVYGVADYKKGAVVGEDAPLERSPEKRGFYSWSKLKADQIVAEAIAEKKIPIISLRPGTIWGPGGEIFTPMMGFSLGEKLFAVIGNGEFVLPFVYIDNLVEAIVKGIEEKDTAGGVYNVVDPERITKKEYMKRLVKKIHPKATCIYIPYCLLISAVYFQEKLFSWVGRKPFLTRYRLNSSQKSILYDSSKLQKELNWKPSVSVEEGIKGILNLESRRQRGPAP